MGLEPTPEEYVEKMVEVFAEVRRVLRDDAVCFLNLGDTYATGELRNKQGQGSHSDGFESKENEYAAQANAQTGRKLQHGLKPKDLCGIPWRVAFALQADGWWLRQDIIWAKPNPMPESVTDRCTKAHEYIFLLAKRGKYFYDAEAIKESATTAPHAPGYINGEAYHIGPMDRGGKGQRDEPNRIWGASGRNKRSVWTIATHPYPEAHFATFPPELPRLCILAGTSERGACPECGAPRRRIVERKSGMEGAHGGLRKRADAPGAEVSETSVFRTGTIAETTTTGWEPTCECGREDTEPCLVLDPFMGAGTAGLVAKRLGRDYLGIELNADYAAMAERRIKGDMPLFAEAEA